MGSQKEMNHLQSHQVSRGELLLSGDIFPFFWQLHLSRRIVGAHASLADLQQTWVAFLCPSYFGSFDWWFIHASALIGKEKTHGPNNPPTIGGFASAIFPGVFPIPRLGGKKLRCAQWHWWDQWMPSSWVTRRRLGFFFSTWSQIKKDHPLVEAPPMSHLHLWDYGAGQFYIYIYINSRLVWASAQSKSLSCGQIRPTLDHWGQCRAEYISTHPSIYPVS